MERSPKGLVLVFLIPILCALVPMTRYNIRKIETARNYEREQFPVFWDGDVYEQELMVCHTDAVKFDFLARYDSASEDEGIHYTSRAGEMSLEGFIPLAELADEDWNMYPIPIPDSHYVGKATVRIEAVGLGSGHEVILLLNDAATQRFPECVLTHNGELIPNGMLYVEYLYNDFSVELHIGVIALALLLFIWIWLEHICASVRQKPALWAFGLLTILVLLRKLKELRVVPIQSVIINLYPMSWQNLGFVKRAFAGTIIELCQLQFTERNCKAFGLFSVLVMLLLEVAVVYRSGQWTWTGKAREKAFFLFTCLPLSSLTFFSGDYLGRFDANIISAFLLCLMCISWDRGLFLVPVISLLATLLHDMYVPNFLPFIFCILLYRWYVTRNENNLLCLALTSVSTVGLVLWNR